MALCGHDFLAVLVLALTSLTSQVIAENGTKNGLDEDMKDMLRIYGGESTTASKFPWQVLVSSELINPTPNGNFETCGGSIISQTWIMSAAHCYAKRSSLRSILFTIKVKRINLVFGVTDSDKIDTDKKVFGDEINEEDINDHLFIHEKYSENAPNDNDIALIKLMNPPKFSTVIKSIILATDDDYDDDGMLLTTSGFGITEEGGADAQILQGVEGLQTQTRAWCKNTWMTLFTDKMICQKTTTMTEIKTTCQGDSGSAAVVKPSGKQHYVQIGIVSRGSKCGASLEGSIFMFVPAYRDWIFRQISERSCPNHKTNDECNMLAFEEKKCHQPKDFQECKATCACDNCFNLWSETDCKNKFDMGWCGDEEHKLQMFQNCKETCGICRRCTDIGWWKYICPLLVRFNKCTKGFFLIVCAGSCTTCGFPE